MKTNSADLLRKLFRFDEPAAEFELLETETGEPHFFGSWEAHGGTEEASARFLSPSLEKNLTNLEAEFRIDINPDVIIRRFALGGKVPAAVVFVEGMVNNNHISDFILKPAMHPNVLSDAAGSLIRFAVEHIISIQDAQCSCDWNDLKTAISEGRSAVLIDGEAEAILLETRGFPMRSVGEPKNETAILGAQEAFTENIRTNISLLRKIVKTDDLVCEFRPSGGRNQVKIAIAYREGVANHALVNEVKRRLAHVDTLKIMSVTMLEQLTESYPYSPLPQSLVTERPDRAASSVMDGKVVIFCEGSPQVQVVPVTLFALMASAEDAYLRPISATIIRFVRYFGAFLSTILPGYFVALVLHHQGMLSGEILATVASSRSMVFMPLALEMIFLQLVFQLVREASVGAPGAMGQSVGIIGGLILGQAAVAANIISTFVLIIVALAGLGNFTIPDYRLQIAVAYFRILLVIAAWAGGLLGLTVACLLTLARMASLKSYGVPFFSPVAPKTNKKEFMILPKKRKSSTATTDFVNTGRHPL